MPGQLLMCCMHQYSLKRKKCILNVSPLIPRIRLLQQNRIPAFHVSWAVCDTCTARIFAWRVSWRRRGQRTLRRCAASAHSDPQTNNWQTDSTVTGWTHTSYHTYDAFHIRQTSKVCSVSLNNFHWMQDETRSTCKERYRSFVGVNTCSMKWNVLLSVW